MSLSTSVASGLAEVVVHYRDLEEASMGMLGRAMGLPEGVKEMH